MTVLGAVRLHERGVARLLDEWISLGDGGEENLHIRIE